ncbi:MAG TPA: DUF402 domain-containing protein [Thermodesulfobacteriota bacterium]|nr:DUF402 domain-containing protein [Thermodesulfobacteriota bacterium]
MLDLFRSAVVPSAALHHRLRIINPKKLEKAEEEIQARPRRKEQIEKRVFKEAVLEPLGKAESLRLDHIKISGKPVHLREGALLETKGSRVRIKRSFTQGRYDGLRLPIEAGDYSVTEFEEGAWHVKHAYYSRDGRLKGEYYNINTPVELYPFGGRYLDLEIDVVRRAGEQPLLVDREDLAALARNGKISPRLEERALQVADGLVEELKES